MEDRLAEIHKGAELDWQEFSVKAKLAIESATQAITAAIVKRKKDDASQAELSVSVKEEGGAQAT
jgi:hypothetical protein